MPSAPSTPDPLIGATLGRYTIESRLGAGGMGAVYQAKEAGMLGRTVALKVLPARLAGEGEFVARFAREAQRAAGLRHGNIVQIYDADQADGHYFMAMQLMDGGSLADLIARHGALDPAVAARVVRDVARGLACAHGAGIVHRDIKPANIFLDDHGARLGDFGLVKSVDGDDQPLTQTGMILGTPHYMAPEQCEGATDVDHRADLYALGLVLYHALSGKIPAKGSTPLQIIRHRCMEDPEPLRQLRPDVPAALATLVDQLLVRDRAGRLGDAAELARRLDQFLGEASGDAATLALPASGAVAPAGPVSQAVTGSHAGQPASSGAETVDLPGRADSGVAPSTGLGSSPAAPPPPPPPPSGGPATPTPPTPPGSRGPAPPPRPPSTQARPPKRAGGVVLYTCLALFVGLVVLPAGCVALVLFYSDDSFDFPVPGQDSRRPEDLEAFVFGLQALGGKPHVQLELAERPVISEFVDVSITGSLTGGGLVFELGPFTDQEFGDDYRFRLVLDAPDGLFRPARGTVERAVREVPPMTLVGATLTGDPPALVFSGHWNVDRRKQLPLTIRIGTEPPPAPKPGVGPPNPGEVYRRCERDRAQDPLGAGALLCALWDGATVGVEVGGVWQGGLYGSVEVEARDRVRIRVLGLDPTYLLGCEELSVLLDLSPDSGTLGFAALSFTGVLDGEEVHVIRLADARPYVASHVNGQLGLLLTLDPQSDLVVGHRFMIYLDPLPPDPGGKGK